MFRAIFGEDIRIGDTIRTSTGRRGKVLEKLYVDSGGQNFRLDNGHFCVLSGGVVGLVHRPSDQTEHQLLAALDAATERVRRLLHDSCDQTIYEHLEDPGQAIAALREALDNYELSKPPMLPEMHDGEVGPGYPRDAMPLG